MHEKPWIDTLISWTLNLGTLIAILFVFCGGAMFLSYAGYESIDAILDKAALYPINVSIIIDTLNHAPAIGLIEIGLFCLIATQVLRVAMLCLYYIYTKDYWFIAINLFVLIILIYSFVWRDIH